MEFKFIAALTALNYSTPEKLPFNVLYLCYVSLHYLFHQLLLANTGLHGEKKLHNFNYKNPTGQLITKRKKEFKKQSQKIFSCMDRYILILHSKIMG